jgi:hypothetical protein
VPDDDSNEELPQEQQDEPGSADQRREQLAALEELARAQKILDASQPSNGTKQKREEIQLPADNRELHDFAREVGKIVCANGLYRRDMTAVIINSETTRLDPMSAELFRTWVSDFVACFRFKKVKVDEDETVTVKRTRTMLLDTARGSLASLHLLAQLPVIQRVNETRLPVILKNGRIDLLQPGYLAERAIYTFDDGLTLNESMSLEEAVAIINELLQYFPFPTARSKAVQLAGMLTMFCASMLPKDAFRPALIFTANTTGAGKTLCAKICIVPIVGAASTRTFPRKEEAKKVLDVVAMSGANYALFDNIRGKIGGEEVESMITASKLKGRILGESTEFVVDNVATLFFTGNQSVTTPDMAERSLFVELFVQEADNRDRKIPFVIDDTYLAVPENRARILSALGALVRGWDAAGRPAPLSVMPRFEAWSRIVAAIVANAGFGDPLAKPDLKTGGDEELRDMTILVKRMAPTEEGETRSEMRFADIVDIVQELGLFADVEVRSGKSYEFMFDETGVTPAGKSHFGKLLARFDGRVFADQGKALRFVVEGKGNTRRFAVLTPEDQSPAEPEGLI